MMRKGKKEPWRIVVGCIAVAYIVWMWVENDVLSIYSTMPKEQAVSLVATTVLVSLLKVGAIAGGILLMKCIVGKVKDR